MDDPKRHKNWSTLLNSELADCHVLSCQALRIFQCRKCLKTLHLHSFHVFAGGIAAVSINANFLTQKADEN